MPWYENSRVDCDGSALNSTKVDMPSLFSLHYKSKSYN